MARPEDNHDVPLASEATASPLVPARCTVCGKRFGDLVDGVQSGRAIFRLRCKACKTMNTFVFESRSAQ